MSQNTTMARWAKNKKEAAMKMANTKLAALVVAVTLVLGFTVEAKAACDLPTAQAAYAAFFQVHNRDCKQFSTLAAAVAGAGCTWADLQVSDVKSETGCDPTVAPTAALTVAPTAALTAAKPEPPGNFDGLTKKYFVPKAKRTRQLVHRFEVVLPQREAFAKKGKAQLVEAQATVNRYKGSRNRKVRNSSADLEVKILGPIGPVVNEAYPKDVRDDRAAEIDEYKGLKSAWLKKLRNCTSQLDKQLEGTIQATIDKHKQALAADPDDVDAEDALKIAEARMAKFQAEKPQTMACTPEQVAEIQAWLTGMAAQDISKLSPTDKLAFDKALKEALAEHRPEYMILIGSEAYAILNPSANEEGDGTLVNVDDSGSWNGIGSPTITFGMENPQSSWGHNLVLELRYGGGQGEDSVRQYGVSINQPYKFWGLEFEIGARGEWAFTKPVSLVYGAGLFLGWRETLHRLETDPDGSHDTSNGVTFGASGWLGLNLWDWADVGIKGRGRPLPASGELGFFLAVTGLGPVRVGVEWLPFNKTADQVEVSTPVNFHGFLAVDFF